jgi:hypothetical protein
MTRQVPPEENYEALRRALHERGYLEPPLERIFLSGSAEGARSRHGGGWLAPVLAGLFSGPPLAVLLAAVVVAQSHGAIRIWPDGALYALFFAPVLGVLVAVIEAIVAIVIRLIARRVVLSPGRTSWIAGITVGLGFAGYLGFWAMRHSGTLGPQDLLSLALLALGAGLTGRIVSAAALIEATLVSGVAPHERRVSLWRSLLAGALLFVLAAALVALAGSGESRAVPVDDQGDRRVFQVIVAWDGLSREVVRGIDRLTPGWSAATFGPHTAWSWSVPAQMPTSDPIAFWTSVATGCAPSDHGIDRVVSDVPMAARSLLQAGGIAAAPQRWLARLLPTRPGVATADARRIPTFWEIAAATRKVAVIGWWASWPAVSPGASDGYVISDAAYLSVVQRKGVEQTIYPATWGGARAPAWLTAATQAAPPAAGEAQSLEAIVREAQRIDRFLIEALREVQRDPDLALAVVYLPGLDILRERAVQAGVDPFALADRIEEHVRAVGDALRSVRIDRTGEWLAIGWPGRVAALESGWVGWPERWAVPSAADSAQGLGLGSTWLAHHQLPIDDRICAEPLFGPVRRVRTLVQPARPAEVDEALEQDVLEQLRSLGYVQ